MGQSTPEPTLEQLLAHPALWRGRSAARLAAVGTGWPPLDAALPGGGWPVGGVTEILTARSGLGELRLFVPLLQHLGRVSSPRWVAWIAPPFEPYAPALVAAGIPVEHQLVVRTAEPAWAIEQALDSGGCSVVLGWLKTRTQVSVLRRLQLATQRSQTPAVLFRPLAEARHASPAELRIVFEPLLDGARLQLIKSRGGDRQPLELYWSSSSDVAECSHGAT